jgi:type IV secretory pathway VirB10-like protein
MKHLRKLVLVPLEEWERLKGKKSQKVVTIDVPTPAAAAADTLNPLTMKKKKTMTTPPPPPALPSSTSNPPLLRKSQGDEKMKKKKDSNRPLLRIEDFSIDKRYDAKKLLTLLKKSGRLNFNSKMEMVYNGQVIKDSNIVSLIEHALSRKNTKMLKGVRRFYSLLRDLGVPNTLIKNKWGRDLVKPSKTISK